VRRKKVALVEKSKVQIGTCLQLYHSSIDDYNKSNNDSGGLELIPFSKDGSRFCFAGNVKDSILYLKKDGDNGGFFVLFHETADKKNQVTIKAKYEDGQTAKACSGWMCVQR
jgi:hypothetical protein